MRFTHFKLMIFTLLTGLCISAGFLASGSFSTAQADEDVTFVNEGSDPIVQPSSGAIDDASVFAPQIGGASVASVPHPHHVRHTSMTAYYPYDSSSYYPTSYMPTYVAPPLPPPTYVDEDSGGYCRQFSEQKRVDNQVQESYGTACLQADGTWRVEHGQ